TINIQKLFDTTKAIPMFFNGIAYFFEQIYSQLNTTEADYSPYGLFSQPHPGQFLYRRQIIPLLTRNWLIADWMQVY
ncbi:MAG: hypothetical protein IJA96_01260, partial [Alistipes sp.]|nr:hypothetical protein [Alistipes sp.]